MKPDTSGASGRIASVDALRGLTILLMVFVNDLGHGAPSWMHHIQPPNADGMTLADVVFPSFLFIVGMSIPLAFEKALASGKSRAALLWHVLTRTATLLLMGVIELNSGEESGFIKPLWSVLAFTALVLAWCALPSKPGRKRSFIVAAKVIGLVSLVVLLALYRRAPGTAELPFWGRVDHWVWLRTGWWGILGLIGWAYLTVGLLVLVLGWRREWLMGALALLLTMHLAFNHGGLFTRLESKSWLGTASGPLARLADRIQDLGEYVSLRDAMGSLAAVATAGCLLGTILRKGSDLQSHHARLWWAITFGVGLVLAGLVTDTFEGINKIAATPTWCFWSAALACAVWMIWYLLLDVARVGSRFNPIASAGANPLVAYFLHPIVIGLAELTEWGDKLLAYKEAGDPWVIIGGSAVMAVGICAAAGVLGRLGLRMRL